MHKTIIAFSLAFWAVSASRAQQSGPRLFLDLPAFYVGTVDVKNLTDVVGLGAESMFAIGTHWAAARAGGGCSLTMAPKADDLRASMAFSPYARIEAGVGPHRTNGNRCGKTHSNAFTAQVRGGFLYDFRAEQGTPLLTLDLAYFYLRDMRKNTELFLRLDYQTKFETVSADLGARFFLNLKANRNY